MKRCFLGLLALLLASSVVAESTPGSEFPRVRDLQPKVTSLQAATRELQSNVMELQPASRDVEFTIENLDRKATPDTATQAYKTAGVKAAY